MDQQQRTADPHILAIGDVAGEPMLAHKAAHEGKVAAEVLAGHPSWPLSNPLPSQRVALAPTPESRARHDRDRSEEGAPGKIEVCWIFLGLPAAGALSEGRTEGLTKWIIDPQSRRVLGCGIVGVHAGDLISEVVLARRDGRPGGGRERIDLTSTAQSPASNLWGAAEVFLARPRTFIDRRRRTEEGIGD